MKFECNVTKAEFYTEIIFYIECFDRYLLVTVEKRDEERTKLIMDKAYAFWVSEDEKVGDVCCEEYICDALRENQIKFNFKYADAEEIKE